jgi:Protein of unknown function (DUF1269)
MPRQVLLPARSPMWESGHHFMKELAASLIPGGSALFALVRKATPDRVLEELKGMGGKILKTSLSQRGQSQTAGRLECGEILSPLQSLNAGFSSTLKALCRKVKSRPPRQADCPR